MSADMAEVPAMDTNRSAAHHGSNLHPLATTKNWLPSLVERVESVIASTSRLD